MNLLHKLGGFEVPEEKGQLINIFDEGLEIIHLLLLHLIELGISNNPIFDINTFLNQFVRCNMLGCPPLETLLRKGYDLLQNIVPDELNLDIKLFV